MISEVVSPEANAVLLVDFENHSDGLAEYVALNLMGHCRQLTCILYSDWGKGRYKVMKNALYYLGYQTETLTQGARGKNAVDMKITSDGVDFLHMSLFDTYGIVCSDYDCTPLVHHIQRRGRKAIGFGKPDAPAPYRNSCHHFCALQKEVYSTYLGAFEREAAKRIIAERGELISAIERAVNKAARGCAWIHVSSVVSILRMEQGDIALADLFCRNWIEFFAAASCCELFMEENGNWLVRLVR